MGRIINLILIGYQVKKYVVESKEKSVLLCIKINLKLEEYEKP